MKKQSSIKATLLHSLQVLHYVEKPETYISTTINCGVYLFSPDIFCTLEKIFKKNQEDNYK